MEYVIPGQQGRIMTTHRFVSDVATLLPARFLAEVAEAPYGLVSRQGVKDAVEKIDARLHVALNDSPTWGKSFM